MIGGGKFANGAVTGAYVMMFNHLEGNFGDPPAERSLTNNSDITIYYKPDNFEDGDWDALPLKPGESTNTPVDAINVDGKVYKVRNGYFSISVDKVNHILFDYPWATWAWPRVDGKNVNWLNQQLYDNEGNYKYFEWPNGSGNYFRDTQWWNIFHPNNQILDPRKK